MDFMACAAMGADFRYFGPASLRVSRRGATIIGEVALPGLCVKRACGQSILASAAQGYHVCSGASPRFS
eukprot:6838362-Pyramimonas_sp.AAC.1